MKKWVRPTRSSRSAPSTNCSPRDSNRPSDGVIRTGCAARSPRSTRRVTFTSTTSSDTKRPVLNAHCWATPWAPLKKKLAAEGVTLTAGMIVNFYGYVDVYAPQGKIGFTIVQIDVQGLWGDVARRRAELVARLSAEGLLEANKRVSISPVPLRVGLVASPGTEGYSDFTGQLLNSGYAFEIVLVKSAVQGEAAPAQIVAAIEVLDQHLVDIICVVRGGGSKGDLAAFDDERVARAIAA